MQTALIQKQNSEKSQNPSSQQSSTTNNRLRTTAPSQSTTNSQQSSQLQNQTQQSTSASSNPAHQYSAHYTGSAQTTQKDDNGRPRRHHEMSALDRLKLIQSNFRQSWNGIQCEFGGRPGTQNFVNRKRQITVIESAQIEDERQKQLWKIFSKIRELDDERVNLQNGSARTIASSTSSNFYNSQS